MNVPKPVSDKPSSSGAWYSAYPIPAVAPTTIPTYTFSSPTLEAQVFTHSSFVPPFTSFNTSPPADNSSLTWLGHPLAQTLCSLHLTTYFPTLSTQAITDLRAALTSIPLHAHLCRLLNLHKNLHTSTPDKVLTSEKVLADLFEAYLAALSRDLGLNRFHDLYAWYHSLLTPFVHAYHNLYAQHSVAPPPRNGRQELAPYTSRLMEYAAKNKLEPPKFEFESNGQQGTDIQWRCCVVLDGRVVSRGIAGSKIEAKHCASKEAIKAIPAAAEGDGGAAAAAVRRKKKEVFRARARGTPRMQGPQQQQQQVQALGPPPPLPPPLPPMSMPIPMPIPMPMPMPMPYANAPGTT